MIRTSFFSFISRSVSAFLAVFLALACLAACSQAPQTPDDAPSFAGGDNITFGLTYVPNIQFSPVYVAEDKGFFTREGINVTVRHHGAEEGLFTALVSGQEDIVLASGDEVLQARDAGLNLVAVATYYHAHPARVIVPQESSIQSLTDLKGKRIGLPGEYGSNWYYLLAVLASQGLQRNDVEIISVGYTQQAALVQGQVDAIIGFVNNEAVQLERSGVPVRLLDPGSEAVPLVSATLVTTTEFAQTHPHLLKGLITATRDGAEAGAASPHLALEATAERDPSLTGPARETAEAVWKATVPLLTEEGGHVNTVQDLGKWKAMAAFLGTVPDMLHAAPDLSAAVTNDFAGS